MKYSPDLIVYDLFITDDDKAEYLRQIHERIIFLCARHYDNKAERSAYYVDFFEEINLGFFEGKIKTNPEIVNGFLEDELIKLSFLAYQIMIRYFFNNQYIDSLSYGYTQENVVSFGGVDVVFGLNIGIRGGFKSDLYWHKKIIEAMSNLENCSADLYAIKGIKNRKPIERKAGIKAVTSNAGIISSQRRWEDERLHVARQWATGRWPTPPKAAEAIYQEAVDSRNPLNVSVRTITSWIRGIKKKS